MTEKNNIDKIFREAAKGFSVPAPEGAWAKLNADLKARRRRRFLWWWFAGILALSVLFYVGGNFMNNKLLNDDKIIINEKGNSNGKPVKEKVDGKSVITNKNIGRNNENIDLQNTNNDVKTHIAKTGNTAVTINKKQQTAVKVNKRKPLEIKENSDKKHAELTDSGTIHNNTNIEPEPVSQTEPNQKTLVSERQADTSANLKTDSVNIKPTSENINPEKTDSDSITSAQDTVPEIKNETKKFKISGYITYDPVYGISGGVSTGSLLYSSAQKSTAEAIGNIPGSSFSNNFSIGLFVYKHLYVNLGYQAFKVISKGDFKITAPSLNYINIENFGTTPLGYYSFDNINNVMQMTGFSCVDQLRNFDEIKSTVQLYGPTFSAGYYSMKNNWIYGIRGGINLLFAGSGTVEARYNNEWFELGTLSGLRKVVFGLKFSGEIIHMGKNNFIWGLTSDINFFVNSLTTTAGFGFYPYGLFIGPKIGMKF